MNLDRNQPILLGIILVSIGIPSGMAILQIGRPAEIAAILIAADVIVVLHILLNHGDNQELTQELATIQYQPDGSSALETGIEEARQTLDSQIENLNDIDTKAVRILRVNVLLIGLILSALTFSSKAEAVRFEDFLNIYVGAGVSMLALSTAAAGLTYTASDFRAGVSKENIVMMLRNDLTGDEVNRVLSKSYAKWIRNNQSAEILNAFYSTSTILLLIYAVAYLSLGIHRALVGPVPVLLEGSANLMVLVITLVSGYISQVKQVVEEIDLQFG